MKHAAGVLVIGGGLSGTIAALRLARADRAVTLLEKTRGPHDKVCGEFLSGEAVGYLQACGLHPDSLGGVPIRSVRLITQSFARESALPFPAWSLTRRTLDEALLRRASEAGVFVLRDAAVRSLQHDGEQWSALLRDDRTFQAGDVMLAAGKLDLNGWPRPQGMQSGLVGFKMYYRLTEVQLQSLGTAVELIPFAGGYAGLQQVEGGCVNLCLLIDLSRLRTGHRQWSDVVEHVLEHSRHLHQRLQGATALLLKPLTASHLPYGHVQRAGQQGLWRVGDQAAVIPSFCGDGMAIALHSGALAAASLLRGVNATAYQEQLHQQLASRVRTATRLSQLMVRVPQALHLVRLLPGLLQTIAAMTRIPERALATAQYKSGGEA